MVTYRKAPEHQCSEVFSGGLYAVGSNVNSLWLFAQPREDNPNFRQETTEGLQINILTHIASWFSLPPFSPSLHFHTFALST